MGTIRLSENANQSNSRLDRIEDKIDRLFEAMIAIARAEEKMLAIEHSFQIVVGRLGNIEVTALATAEKAESTRRSVALATKIGAATGSILVAIGIAMINLIG